MKAKPSTTSLAALALVAIVIFWSYNWVVTKSVLQYIGPFEFVVLRCFMGSVLLFLLLFFMGRPLAPPPFKPTILIALFQTCGMMGVSQLALVQGGAGSTAILAYTLPFWMILLAAVFLKERISRTQLLAVTIAATGLLLVMQPWEKGGSLVSSLLAVLSGFLWACAAIVTKKMYGRYVKVDLLNLTAWQMFIGCLILAVVAVFMNERPIIWSDYLIFALAYNAFFPTALAWVLWLFILRALPTGVSGLSMLLVPVASVFLAWAILGEAPNLTEWTGIALIAVALMLTTGAAAMLQKLLAKERGAATGEK